MGHEQKSAKTFDSYLDASIILLFEDVTYKVKSTLKTFEILERLLVRSILKLTT